MIVLIIKIIINNRIDIVSLKKKHSICFPGSCMFAFSPLIIHIQSQLSSLVIPVLYRHCIQYFCILYSNIFSLFPHSTTHSQDHSLDLANTWKPFIYIINWNNELLAHNFLSFHRVQSSSQLFIFNLILSSGLNPMSTWTLSFSSRHQPLFIVTFYLSNAGFHGL